LATPRLQSLEGTGDLRRLSYSNFSSSTDYTAFTVHREAWLSNQQRFSIS